MNSFTYRCNLRFTSNPQEFSSQYVDVRISESKRMKIPGFGTAHGMRRIEQIFLQFRVFYISLCSAR